MKKEKGITLIALIITIIVMLILVAVTVTVAINGGLFGETDKAALDTERESIYERLVALAKWDKNGYIDLGETAQNIVNEFGEDAELSPALGEINNDSTTEITVTIKGKKGNYVYTITKESIGEKNPTPEVAKNYTLELGADKLTTKNYTKEVGSKEITIPKGYGVLKTGETEVLLESNEYDDYITANIDNGIVIQDTNENEFVWIPVTSDFASTYTNGAFSEPTSAPNYTSQEAECGYSTDDYAPMLTSVNKYKGFYVGRYETTNSSGSIGSKKGAAVVVNIAWFDLYIMQKNANVTGKEEGIVQPTMMWGQQWDAMCSFIGSDADSPIGNKEGNTQKVVTTAGTSTYTSLGNKEDILKNIYDLRGNVRERTAETYNTGGRTIRGGIFSKNFQASYRSSLSPTSITTNMRFSPCTLYKIA